MPNYIRVIFNTPLHNEFTYLPPDKDEGITVGMRIEAPFGKLKKIGIIIGVDQEFHGEYELKQIIRLIDKQPLLTEDLISLGQWVSSFYYCSLGEALFMMLPSGKREKSLPALFEEEIAPPKVIHLSEEQQQALDAIITGDKDWLYLYGITGSGKTEVFLRAAEYMIGHDKGVIYLVPEIALSQQLSEHLRQRFKGQLAILHSRLTPSQKLTEWNRILSGEAKIVVGARSAIFAPMPQLGLIIIDEEHEGSYKAGSTPRYHARQVAFLRSKNHNAKLVMGSATPSVEAYKLMQDKRIERLNLTKRLAGGHMPELNVVDLRLSKDLITKDLYSAIDNALKEGRQALLFLNRRGFTYTFHCNSCGEEITCKHCSVPLTYHKSKKALVCHYCGYQEPIRNVCPSCGSLDIGYHGFGTEHVEEEVQKLFPNHIVERLDTDSVQKKGVLEKAIKDFQEGRIHILIGTQMVAKGLNFPGVQVVGILMADSGLGLPDFRASERTFSLLTQVAGRAGRFTPDGKVYIQTLRPDAPSIRLSSKMKITQFYNDELNMRKILDFPPYTRLIKLTFRSKNKNKAGEDAKACLQDLMFLESDKTEILGPAEAPLFQIAQNYRYQLLIKTKDFNQVHHQLALYVKEVNPSSSVYREIDIDPIQMM
ncbi:replication restart helicase PriA [Spirochaeta cellobiosiphila]|uniref:replication restart helicase PriA n=1 Tax=Spirochaeta cellobiosiphila TaxID=504483 RepID=UPI00041CAF32|nr:primosomal protein N' [Spirochaeta cellobiosiphila]